MIRFFADPQDISASSIKLSTEDSKHIRTLRLSPEEQFIVCDGNGTDYLCKLGKPGEHATADILSGHKSTTEPTVKCNVYMAFSKGDRLDYAVQKSVELGVREIILFESDRCVAIPHDIPKKTARLGRIAFETAKLCDRGIIPAVSCAGDFKSAINKAVDESELVLFFYESEEELHLKSVLQQHFSQSGNHVEDKLKNISIITGPEGGFTSQEVEFARSKNIPVVSLGPRVMRSETAPVAALAAIMYQSDNM